MDKNGINSHDRFFKELFSKKKEVSEFVEKTLPTEITNNLHLESLELDNTEYVNSQLRTNFSDLVYNCKYGENTEVKISLLFEHKSAPEKYPHFQLLGYMLNIWRTQIKQGEKITPIIPIIFYHGKQKWKKKIFESSIKGLDENLQKYIPTFDYELIDLGTFSDKEISKLFESIQLQVGLLVLKNIYEEQKLIQETAKIFGGVEQLLQTEEGINFFESIIAYLFYATKIDTIKYVEAMKTISKRASEKFVSTGERLEMKGIEKGIKKVAFSMIQERIKDSIILKVTNLTQKQLDYLKDMKSYQIDLGL